MKKIFIIVFAASVVLATTLLSGCGNSSSSTSQTTEKKKYTIATDATYAPFEFEKDGKYVGIDIDLLNAIAKEENFEVDIKPMNFEGIIPALTSNQIDGAIAGISITDKRKEVLDFSDGYYNSGLALVGKKDNTQITSINDLTGKTFAVKKGTAGATFAESIKDKYKATLKYFDDSTSMFQAVKNGNADVTFEDYPVIAYEITQDPDSDLRVIGDKLTTVPYGFAVNKGSNPELLQKFNAGLKKLKANGQYDKIVNKYIKK
jgi:glutamine transport system substrate-binding protein